MYTAYKLTRKTKKKLIVAFSQVYSKVIAHHITVEFGVSSDAPPPEVASIEVVGSIDSEDGLQALVVSVNGNTVRSDGSIYHITWSLSPGRYKPVDSNNLLKTKGYIPCEPLVISTVPMTYQ